MQDTETGHNNPSRSPLRHLSSFPWGWAASPQPAGWRPLFAHPQHCPKKAAQDRAATVPKSWRGHQPPPVVEWLEQRSPMTSCRAALSTALLPPLCQEHTPQTQRHPAEHQPPEESIHQETPEEMTTTTKTFPNSQNYTKKVRGEGTRKQLGRFLSIFNLLLPKLPLTSTNNCGQATRGRVGQAGLHYLRRQGEG